MKVQLLGGFLGAGKTTAIRALAKLLESRGERVAIVTNDQGTSLVDTAACRDVVGDAVQEIGGGCFCCQYNALEDALEVARAGGASVALAEAVGSCTDLVATVLSPLADRESARYSLAPLSVLVDPWRAQQVQRGELPDDVAYLFGKQLEEADVIVLTRSDLDAPDVEPWLRAQGATAPIVRVSGLTGHGIADWAATQPLSLAGPLDIDYDRYAAAEALLGWANANVTVAGDIDPQAVVADFFAGLKDQPVAHLKVRVTDPAVAVANQVRAGQAPVGDWDTLPRSAAGMQLVVNARIAVPPAQLETLLQDALASAAKDAEVRWADFECFEPGRPVPVHRYAVRCDPAGDAACCAAFYQRPDIKYLLGESYHPGGEKLTLQLAAGLDLAPGGQIMDVACGLGTSLKVITREHSVRGVGLDVSAAILQDTDAITFRAGDAHEIPGETGSFDGVLCECALSTFADQPQALSEMRRVLKPGARVAISDMIANGPLPEEVLDWIHIGTCLAHARTLQGYADLIAAAGFEIIEVQDTSWALADLLRHVKRRLLGVAIARRTGMLDVDIDVAKGRRISSQAQVLLSEGLVGYGTILARNPG